MIMAVDLGYHIAGNVGGVILWRISKILYWQKIGELPTWEINQKFRSPDASGAGLA